MNLTVLERLTLQGILPQEGDFIVLKLVRKLRESLSFTEKEITDIDFKHHWRCPSCSKVELSPFEVKCPDCKIYMIPTGQISWDEEKAQNMIKDVHMGDNMHALCATTLKKLSDSQKLTERHISLYEKFIT